MDTFVSLFSTGKPLFWQVIIVAGLIVASSIFIYRDHIKPFLKSLLDVDYSGPIPPAPLEDGENDG